MDWRLGDTVADFCNRLSDTVVCSARAIDSTRARKHSRSHTQTRSHTLALTMTAYVASHPQGFIRANEDAENRLPFWIQYRGYASDIDEPDQYDREIGGNVQRYRWIDYHAMTRTPEVVHLQSNGTSRKLLRTQHQLAAVFGHNNFFCDI